MNIIVLNLLYVKFTFTTKWTREMIKLTFSRYLYSKVKEANTKFVLLVLNKNEIEFLNMFNVDFYKLESKANPNTYLVNSEEVKKLFCN